MSADVGLQCNFSETNQSYFLWPVLLGSKKNSILPIIEKNNNAEMLFFECGNVVVVVTE